jgi:hypothetical protein
MKRFCHYFYFCTIGRLEAPGVDPLADDNERQLYSAGDLLLNLLRLENLLDGGHLHVVHLLNLTRTNAVATIKKPVQTSDEKN